MMPSTERGDLGSEWSLGRVRYNEFCFGNVPSGHIIHVERRRGMVLKSVSAEVIVMEAF